MALDGIGFGAGNAGSAMGMPAIGVPVTNPDPSADYIATGPGRFTPRIPQLLLSDFDDVTKHFGHRVYEAMLTDPACYSQFLALKLSILSGPLKIMPAVRDPKSRYKPPALRGDSDSKSKGEDGASGGGKPGVPPQAKSREKSGSIDPNDKVSVTPGKAKLAAELAEFEEREVKRLKTPLKTTLLQMLDCMAFGNKLAEKTREYCETGQDKGKLVLKSLKVKPWWAWNFVVDSFLNWEGVLTFVPLGTLATSVAYGSKLATQGGFLILPTDKFCLFTWLQKDHDPRGTSALRAAYDWWNLKQQLKPYMYQHMVRFGSPSLDMELSEKDTANGPTMDPVTGQPTGGISTPAQRNLALLLAFQNNSALVRAAGSKLNVLEPKSDKNAFIEGFDFFDRQICLAIGLQTRASMEAEHGSKADSETAQDVKSLVTEYGREYVGDAVGRQIFYDSIVLNYGEDVAEELTPELVVGATEAKDKGEMWKAAASIGYSVGNSQLEEMDVELGLPERDLEADAAVDQAKMDAATAAAVETKSAAGTSGNVGSSGSGPESRPKPAGVPAKAGGGK